MSNVVNSVEQNNDDFYISKAISEIASGDLIAAVSTAMKVSDIVLRDSLLSRAVRCSPDLSFSENVIEKISIKNQLHLYPTLLEKYKLAEDKDSIERVELKIAMLESVELERSLTAEKEQLEKDRAILTKKEVMIESVAHRAAAVVTFVILGMATGCGMFLGNLAWKRYMS